MKKVIDSTLDWTFFVGRVLAGAVILSTLFFLAVKFVKMVYLVVKFIWYF
jgi:hypothetical protein